MALLIEWGFFFVVGSYSDVFVENDVDAGRLYTLTEEELEEMGGSNPAHRDRIMNVCL